MVTNVQAYRRPSSLEEAWNLLREGGKAAKPVGGGIDVGLYLPSEITTLVDLARLPLAYVREEEGALVIGAGTTMTELLEDRRAQDYLDGILTEVLLQVASPLLRNLATVGGTLASRHPWSDVIPLFLVFDAGVELFDGASRWVRMEDFVARRRDANRGLITAVRLPVSSRDAAAAFTSFTRTGFDVAILNCACYVSALAGTCEEARIALGGTPDIARRLSSVEETLNGGRFEPSSIETAAARAAETIEVRDDRRASAGYRRKLASVAVRRCLSQIADRLKGTT